MVKYIILPEPKNKVATLFHSGVKSIVSVSISLLDWCKASKLFRIAVPKISIPLYYYFQIRQENIHKIITDWILFPKNKPQVSQNLSASYFQRSRETEELASTQHCSFITAGITAIIYISYITGRTLKRLMAYRTYQISSHSSALARAIVVLTQANPIFRTIKFLTTSFAFNYMSCSSFSKPQCSMFSPPFVRDLMSIMASQRTILRQLFRATTPSKKLLSTPLASKSPAIITPFSEIRFRMEGFATTLAYHTLSNIGLHIYIIPIRVGISQ